MTTEPQVTHPPVTHPETITSATAPEGTAKAPDKPARDRSRRLRWRMPPPKTIAAVALVVAALELIVWQVGGVGWGIAVHAILAGLGLAPIVAFLIWRRRLRGRQTTTRTQSKTTPGTTRTRRGPLGKLFGPGRKPGNGTLGGGQRKPGLLGKLFPGRRGVPSSGGKPGGSKPGSRGSRNLLSRLFSPGKKPSASRPGPGSGSPGSKRSPGSRFRNPFKGKPGGKSSTGSPTSKSKKAGTAPGHKGKKGSWWPDLVKGVRQGAKPKPTTTAKRKPSPGPLVTKPTPAAKPEADRTEDMVREAVQKAADAKPAPVILPPTGGSTVSGMNRIRSAADELAAAFKDYDEEDMHVFSKEFPQLAEALGAVSGGMKTMASRAETEWPVAAPFVEGLRTMANDVKAAAGTAEESRGTLRRENETDIERGEAPRHGSTTVERKWNV